MGLLQNLRNAFGNRAAVPDTAAPIRLSAAVRPALIYAIGDVHGCLDQLRELEAKIVADAAATPGEKWLVQLGDYIDRGPRSAQVIDHLIAPPPTGFTRICLRGNHEEALLASLSDVSAMDNWLAFGGTETLLSYGAGSQQIEKLRSPGRAQSKLQILEAYIPEEHIAFLKSLASILVVPGFVFVHAGLRPGVPIASQSGRDMLWIRRDFLDAAHDFGATIVHGHTPADTPFQSQHRIGIDTACFMSGKLTAVRVDASGAVGFLGTGV